MSQLLVYGAFSQALRQCYCCDYVSLLVVECVNMGPVGKSILCMFNSLLIRESAGLEPSGMSAFVILTWLGFVNT